MLLAGASTMPRQGSPEPQHPPTGIPMQNLDDRFQQMAQIFEIASSDTKVPGLFSLPASDTLKFAWSCEQLKPSAVPAGMQCRVLESSLQLPNHPAQVHLHLQFLNVAGVTSACCSRLRLRCWTSRDCVTGRPRP